MEPENVELEEEKAPGKFTKGVLEWAEEIIGAVVIITVIFTFFARVISVQGASMEPNYIEGDRVLIVGTPFGVQQGDVVIIANVLEEPIIKRVIATEGQVVDIDNEAGAVVVDGKPVDDSQFGVANGITGLPYSSFPTLDFPQTVPEGCVFVLGDNRPISKDSRYREVGMVDERNILGKAVLFLFPFSKFGAAH